jgi:hypothetical protein
MLILTPYLFVVRALSPDSAGPSFGLSRFLQANLFRRNAVYITAILLGCSFGVQAYDAAFDAAWEFNNKGVSERAKAEQQEQQ